MEQKEFTDYIISKILDRFPQFKDLCIVKPNNIIDIDYKSKKGKLTFWLTTQNKEITLGFTGDTQCDWHAHMSLFGANTPNEELHVAIDLINDILSDKTKIIHSSIRGFYCIVNISEENEYKEKNEVINVFKWSDL